VQAGIVSSVFVCFLASMLSVTGCSGDDDDDDDDTGPAECPTAAPDTGTPCPETIGSCTYTGMNPACPPLAGQCQCVQGGWVCEVPECSTCPETCGDDCCDLDDVCREGEGGLSRACGPEGDGTGAMFTDCGHESDCAGIDPICSPICGPLCCTFNCEVPEDCDEGACVNRVCTPE
jgi:hypothetical protein